MSDQRDARKHARETSPLLHRDGDENPHKGASFALKARVLSLLAIIMTNYYIGIAIFGIPVNALMNRHFCKTLFPDDQSNCKRDEGRADAVSAAFTKFDGWANVANLLPSLIFSIPYGLLADKIGRKKTFSLTIVGLSLYLAYSVVIIGNLDRVDIRWLWAAGLWFAVGGGVPVFTATIFAFISDVTEPETRSRAFFLFGSILLGAQIVGPFIGLIVNKMGDWTSIWIGLGLCCSAMPISLLLPETKNTPGHNTRHMVPEETDLDLKPTFATKMEAMWREAVSIARYQFWENTLLGLSLFSLLFTSIARALPMILNQYAYRRYNMSWAEVGLLTSVKSFVALGVTALLLPALDYFLRKRCHMSLIHKDMWLVRISILVMMVGALCVGLSPTVSLLIASLTIYGLGSGYEFAMRAMLAQVAGDRVATVYTTMSFMESAGDLIASPSLAYVYQVGLRWGDGWIGLPFFTLAGLFGVAAAIVWLVRTRDFVKAEEEEEAEDEHESSI